MSGVPEDTMKKIEVFRKKYLAIIFFAVLVLLIVLGWLS